MALEERYTTEDVRAWLKNGEPLNETDFAESNLIGVHLPKISLRGASFRNADLRHANLAGANLEETDFTGANLTGIKLTGANLQKAILENATAKNADLLRADLREANLRHANLTFSSLRSANVTNADFTNATLRGANLNGIRGGLEATFDGADLRAARVLYSGLDKIDLQGKGIQINSDTIGMRAHVFKFIKTSWTDFVGFRWLLTPFRWIGKLVMLVWMLLKFPFTSFYKNKKPAGS